MPEGWLKIPLGSDRVKAGTMEATIAERCAPLWMAAHAPQSAALFASHVRSRKRESEMFISPAMARICQPVLTELDPIPTTAPARGAVYLLLGHDGAGDMLLSDDGKSAASVAKD